jgi:hypothetical protein
MYTFDVTEKVVTLRHGRIADSILTDKNLVFTADKNIPMERKSTVIGAATGENIRNMMFRIKENEKIPMDEAEKLVELAEQKQLAEVIAKTISQPSSLNIFETRLPSANPFTDPFVQVYELEKFQTDLKKLGYDQWAGRLGAAIGWTRHS